MCSFGRLHSNIYSTVGSSFGSRPEIRLIFIQGEQVLPTCHISFFHVVMYQNKQCRVAWLISTICWGSVFTMIVLWKAGTRMSLCSILFQKFGMKCTANVITILPEDNMDSNHQYLPKSCFHWDELNVYLKTYFEIEKLSCLALSSVISGIPQGLMANIVVEWAFLDDWFSHIYLT